MSCNSFEKVTKSIKKETSTEVSNDDEEEEEIILSSVNKPTTIPICCSVPFCKGKIGHSFPINPKERRSWCEAIRRLEDGQLWIPKVSENVFVCNNHFIPSDFESGEKNGNLKPEAVPSQLLFRKASVSEVVKSLDISNSVKRKRLPPPEDIQSILTNVGCNITIGEDYPVLISKQNSWTTTDGLSVNFCIEVIKHDHTLIKYYTTFNNYQSIEALMEKLSPDIQQINYKCENMTLINELFLTLMKITTNRPDIELAYLFGVSEKTILKVFTSLVKFMYYKFKSINMDPSDNFVKEYESGKFIPDHPPFEILNNFRNKYPNPNEIISVCCSLSELINLL